MDRPHADSRSSSPLQGSTQWEIFGTGASRLAPGLRSVSGLRSRSMIGALSLMPAVSVPLLLLPLGRTGMPFHILQDDRQCIVIFRRDDFGGAVRRKLSGD